MLDRPLSSRDLFPGSKPKTFVAYSIFLTASILASSCASHSWLHPIYGLDRKPVILPVPTGPTLVEFWASWCDSCAVSLVDIDERSKSSPETRILLVSIDENPQSAEQRLKSLNISLSSLWDKDGTWRAHFEVSTVPELILLDPSGTILTRGQELLETF